jgi:hypothetical protein
METSFLGKNLMAEMSKKFPFLEMVLTGGMMGKFPFWAFFQEVKKWNKIFDRWNGSFLFRQLTGSMLISFLGVFLGNTKMT